MSDKRPVQYLDMVGVGKWFDVPGPTVAKWRRRYASSHPTPVPDVMVGDRNPGWAEDREPEWRAWYESRPGRGAGGGRPPKSA
ncbi:hypothetical protein [Actinomadura opuntiae]|uniref:hypothetical protein n=1 Tax=Actinomadura sp. OS1-43 TaxID=604315 RepID=UPI00255AF271|nr:hypothetical protein [Actinomadura sp. OS1-43]MDL4812755.1 hypothetical protein [Actinomadura sp. OS1-43]